MHQDIKYIKKQKAIYSDAEEDLISIVIVNSGAKQIGFIVDELHDKQEVVIKPLVDFLACIKGISGATILGDGSIIDPNELADISMEKD